MHLITELQKAGSKVYTNEKIEKSEILVADFNTSVSVIVDMTKLLFRRMCHPTTTKAHSFQVHKKQSPR